jgi:hypothetical protein
VALSARYRTLGPRITGLGKHLLPRKTALGLYSPRHYDRIRGYVVLAHAEIEYCLEKLAEEAVGCVGGISGRWSCEELLTKLAYCFSPQPAARLMGNVDTTATHSMVCEDL